MAKYTMEMVLEYAKIFPENADMGKADGASWQKKIADDGGQYIVNAYFTNQDQIDQLVADGLQTSILGNPRIIEGNAEFGIGKYLKLKRPVPDAIKTFENKGKEVEVNYGGAPGVVDLRDPDNKRWWSFEDDGAIGNGTKAMVQFEVYSRGAGVRLVNVGITEHVPYEPTSNNADDELFKVA
jgi:hypothetical protein